jgi:beta-mannosidase
VRRTISLDGDWERRDFLDEAWRWSDALRDTGDAGSESGPPARAGISAGWRLAHVPGSMLDDAWRAGEVPNPYVDRNSLAAEWVPSRTWVLRRRMALPPDVDPGVSAVLRFEGIDPGGTVFLDGEELGRHTGMFVPFEMDVTGRLEAGREHLLVVALDAAPPMPSQVGRTELARHHRSRMGYGWDFCPRMVHTGIWRSVSLELFSARLGPPRVTVKLDGSSASVDIECPLLGPSAVQVMARLVDEDGHVAAEGSAAVSEGSVRIGLEVANPKLWWPNGLGSPATYRLELRLDDLDEREVRIGLRSVVLRPTEGGPEGALPYTVVVNGRPTWIRGWNWVPMDAAYGVPRPERLRHLIELARRANVNMLRVWGGGLIESEEFYDACDEAGIMVWQEFAQSSSGVTNAPADDADFVALMRREAEAIVPLRAHHPSLAVWCGGNELSSADGRPLDDRHPVLGALRDAVERLDPGRAWLPTSPTGPRFDNSLAAVAEDPASLHDVHGPWEHQGLTEQHELADATTSLLHSEFGVEGMTNLPTLVATVTEPHRSPLGRSNPVMAHRGAWWNNEPFVQRAFGNGLSLEEIERASQHLQADGLRTLIDGDRRRWPRNAGCLPWQLNEPFPNAWCTAAVDYFGVPKAAYHAVAEAYAPISVALGFASQILGGAARVSLTASVVNDTDDALDGELRLALHDGGGRPLSEARSPLRVAANAVGHADETILGLAGRTSDLLILDAAFVTDAGAAATTRRLLSRTDTLEPMRRLPPTTLDAAVRAMGDEWAVTLAAGPDTAALEVRLADARPIGWPERTGAAYVHPNFVTLLPGESREVSVAWRGIGIEERSLRLSGWNVEARLLRHG